MQIERIGEATLYRADCRDVLPGIEGARCLITDPPYRVTSGGKTDAGFGGWMGRGYDNSGNIVTCDLEWSDWLPLAVPAMADSSHAYIFTNDRNLPVAWAMGEEAGLDFHRLLVWNKRAAMPNRWYMQCCEFVLFMKKGQAYPVSDCGVMSLQTVYQRDESDHPTEKPRSLLEMYVRQSTTNGEIVLDPFMGSGSTGCAALRQGRSFVGVEIEQRWFDVACRRLEDATRQPDMFVAPSNPTQSDFDSLT